MNHLDMLTTYAVVSVQTACAIIGGDDGPVDTSTIDRLVATGRLIRPVRGRISTASLRALLGMEREEDRVWPALGTARAERTASIMFAGAGGSPNASVPAPTPANAPPLSAADLPPKLRLLGRRRHGPPNPVTTPPPKRRR